MAIKGLDRFMGESIEGTYEKALSQKENPVQNDEDVLVSAVKIDNPRSYIQIPKYQTVIAIQETHKGKDFYDTLELVAKEKLKVPSPEKFMAHWLNVRDAAVNNGKRLLYADGTVVDKDVTQDLWKYMSSGHNGGCWTWLNALFKEEDGVMYRETDLKVIKKGKDKTLRGIKNNLDQYVMEDAYVDINFNAQGLPKAKSSNQNYSQGSNVYFYYPRNGAVAWFVAGSGWAGLGCYRNPSVSYSALGVFACAEGANDAKNGGKS